MEEDSCWVRREAVNSARHFLFPDRFFRRNCQLAAKATHRGRENNMSAARVPRFRPRLSSSYREEQTSVCVCTSSLLSDHRGSEGAGGLPRVRIHTYVIVYVKTKPRLVQFPFFFSLFSSFPKKNMVFQYFLTYLPTQHICIALVAIISILF